MAYQFFGTFSFHIVTKRTSLVLEKKKPNSGAGFSKFVDILNFMQRMYQFKNGNVAT